MSTYEALDKAILSAVSNGASPLYERKVGQEAKRIAELSGREDFRVIDGRIQALRKAGQIVYHGSKWKPATPLSEVKP